MNRFTKGNANWLHACIVIASIGIPTLSLLRASDSSHALAISPFAFKQLIVVQVIACFPLSWMLISFFSHNQRESKQRFLFLTGIVIGSIFAWITIENGSVIGNGIVGSDFLIRSLVRLVWCLALQIPWCLAGQILLKTEPVDQSRKSLGMMELLLASILALGAPAVHTVDVIQKQTRSANQAIAQMQIFKARKIVTGLCDLGSSAYISGQAPRKLLQVLEKRIELHRRYAAQLVQQLKNVEGRNSQDEMDAFQFTLAGHLIALGELSRAGDILREQARRNPQAALQLATILQFQKDWQSSSRWCEQALKLLGPELSERPERSVFRIQAYKGLVENLRQEKKYRDAELLLLESLETAGQEKPHFHYLLGQHYRMGGRPFDALPHLKAAQLLPEVYQEKAQALIDDIWLKTPACLLRPPQPAYR